MSHQAALTLDHDWACLFEPPELTDDERDVIGAMQLAGETARECPDLAPHFLQAVHRLAESPEAHSVAKKISDRLAEQEFAFDDEHPDSPLPPSEEVVAYALQRTFEVAGTAPVMRSEPRRLFTPARLAPRGRSSRGRRKASRVLVGSSSGGRGDPSRDDDAPARRICKCGEPFIPEDPRQRYCEPACADRLRQRVRYRNLHPPVAKPDKPQLQAVPAGRSRDEPDPDQGFRDIDGSWVWWSEITPGAWYGRKNRVLGTVA